MINDHWDAIAAQDGEHRRFNYAEHLIHRTKDNEPICGFDEAFPKMPSYFRRSVLKHAMGSVEAYHTSYEKWIHDGKEGQEPKLHFTGHSMPVFYRDGMYKEQADKTLLKLYSGKDWIWYPVKLRKTDVDYLQKYWTGVRASAPVLIKKHKKYYLQFSFEKTVLLSDKKVTDQTICAVDLGLNKDAVCCIMKADGTVVSRKFIDFPTEKDRLWHVLNRTRKKQRKYGPKAVAGLWDYAKRLNEQLAIKISRGIVRYAQDNNADVIVFEYLEPTKKKLGKNAQKLQMWKWKDIQNITERMAHRNGIRISRVSAKNTSALAYDGSGPVVRDKDDHSLCTFTTGKRYHCDLSASYNIGARYFIREYLKSFSVMRRSVIEAKVPRLQRRSLCVYADLLDLIQAAGINTGGLTADYVICGENVRWAVELRITCIRGRLGPAA